MVALVAVLEVGDGVFEVLSTSGDTHLGGDDFDKVGQIYSVDCSTCLRHYTFGSVDNWPAFFTLSDALSVQNRELLIG